MPDTIDTILDAIFNGDADAARKLIHAERERRELAGVPATQRSIANNEDVKVAFSRALFSHFVERRDDPVPSGLKFDFQLADAAALLPQQVHDDVFHVSPEDSLLLAKAYRIQLTQNSISLPSLSGPYTGGVAVAIVGESNPIGETEPAFTNITLTAYSVAATTVLTRQVAQDAPVVAQLLPILYNRAMRGFMENMMLNGTGAGQPLGILPSPATLSVTRSGSSITSADLLKMKQRHVRMGGSPIWVVPKGSDASAEFYAALMNTYTGAPDPLLNYPVYESEFLDAGDALALLIDPAAYVIGVRSDSKIDVNEGPGFTRLQLYYRLAARVGGTPWLTGAVTLANGSVVSPFVKLVAS